MENGEFLVKDLDKDIQIATHNADKFNNIRIRKMGERLKSLKEILDSYAETQDLSTLKEYVNTIFNEIKWNEIELSKDEADTNFDYKLIINRIYALLSQKDMSYDPNLPQDIYQMKYEYIINF